MRSPVEILAAVARGGRLRVREALISSVLQWVGL